MIINNVEYLASVLSVIPAVDSSLFDCYYFNSALSDAEEWAKESILGYPLYFALQEDLSGMEPRKTPFAIESTGEQVKESVKKTIAFRALLTGIPMINVVITNNGIGIGESDNLKPASSDRINKLLDVIREQLFFNIDRMIRSISGNAKLSDLWIDSDQSMSITNSIVWTNWEISMQHDPCKFVTNREGFIIKAEHKLRERLSDEFFDSLIEDRRKFNFNIDNNWIFRDLFRIIHDYCVTQTIDQEDVSYLLARINKDLEKYPIYANSSLVKSQVKVNHNEKGGGVAFFM